MIYVACMSGRDILSSVVLSKCGYDGKGCLVDVVQGECVKMDRPRGEAAQITRKACGREEFQVLDSKCSRKQIEVKVDWKNGDVFVRNVCVWSVYVVC